MQIFFILIVFYSIVFWNPHRLIVNITGKIRQLYLEVQLIKIFIIGISRKFRTKVVGIHST